MSSPVTPEFLLVVDAFRSSHHTPCHVTTSGLCFKLSHENMKLGGLKNACQPYLLNTSITLCSKPPLSLCAIYSVLRFSDFDSLEGLMVSSQKNDVCICRHLKKTSETSVNVDQLRLSRHIINLVSSPHTAVDKTRVFAGMCF